MLLRLPWILMFFKKHGKPKTAQKPHHRRKFWIPEDSRIPVGSKVNGREVALALARGYLPTINSTSRLHKWQSPVSDVRIGTFYFLSWTKNQTLNLSREGLNGNQFKRHTSRTQPTTTADELIVELNQSTAQAQLQPPMTFIVRTM